MLYKEGKSVLANININDIFIKEKIIPGQFFSRLEKVPSKLNVDEL